MSKAYNTIKLDLNTLNNIQGAKAKIPSYYDQNKIIKEDEFGVQSDEFIIPARIFTHLDNNALNKTTIFWCHGGPHSKDYSSDLYTKAIKLNSNLVAFDYRGTFPIHEKTIKACEDIKDAGDIGQLIASKYYTSIDTDYGGGHMRDLKAVVSHVLNVSEEYGLDKSKFILAGYSFGGYMTALGMMDLELSDKFAVGICVSGFYNLGNYGSYNCPGDENDIEIQKKRSPLSSAKEISKKMVIIHGGEADKSTLVNLSDTLKFINNLSEAKKEVTFIQVTEGVHKDTDNLLPEILEIGCNLSVMEYGCDLVGLITELVES